MRQTLFYIPDQVNEIPIFGVGLLLVLWIAFSIGLLAWLLRRQGMNADTLGYIPVVVLVACVVLFVLPTLVQAGRGLPIRSYGVMTMLGIVAGVYLLTRRAAAAGIASSIVYSCAVWLCIAGFVGARLFHVFEYWDSSYRHTTPSGSMDFSGTLMAIINVPQGGLVVYGSFVGSMFAFVWLVRRYRLPPLAFADLIAPSLMLGLAIGRLGCLFNGCCFGGTCDLPWALTFPEKSPPYQRQIERGLMLGLQIVAQPQANRRTEVVLEEKGSAASKGSQPVLGWVSPILAKQGIGPGDEIVRIGDLEHPSTAQVLQIFSTADRGGLVSIQTDKGQEVMLSAVAARARSLPVHPTQIYSSVSALLLCLFLLAYHPFRRRDGVVFGLLITIYPIIRILLEVIRTDEAPQLGTGLSISQLISILLLTAVVIYWSYVLWQPPGSLWKAAGGSPPAEG